VSDAAGAGAAAAERSWVLTADVPVALAEIDLEGRLRRANRRFCSLVGRNESELAGIALQRLIHEGDREDHRKRLRALVEAGGGYLRAERYLRPEGTVVWATNEIERTTDAAGHPALLLAAQAAPALLEQAGTGRTRAEAELRRRDEFLNILSHELRSPLAAILVWVRLLRESGSEDVDAQRGLEVIERSGRAIETALDDLVQVARIVAGKPQPATRSPLDLRVAVTTAADGLQEEATRKGVRLARALPADAVIVSGDPGLLQQAITRLLDNAVKFTPAGGDIALSLETEDAAALIRVADTGAGMSADFLPLAFEPFRQDAVPRRTHRGLGLGLSIAHHLVTQHGGRLSVSSPGSGQGSVFTIRLPLAMPAPPDGAAVPPNPA
jgi:PAS domain S-box-containing protein